MEQSFIEIGMTPLIQSGNAFDLTLNASSDDNVLQFDIIRLCFCYRYKG